MTTEQQSNDGEYYIVHTYSGHEERVKRNIELRIKSMDMESKIFDVIVPTEEEIQIKDGKRKSVQKRIFPGYIIVHMEMTDESWNLVRNTDGVTGFISAEEDGETRSKPVTLNPEEVQSIMNQVASGQPRVKLGVDIGQTVKIKEGPFVDFLGTVDEIYPERAKVKVLVSFFGRETPVELDFVQIDKVEEM